MSQPRPGALPLRRPALAGHPPGEHRPAWLGRRRPRSTMLPFLVPFITIAIFGLVVLALGQP